MQVIDIGRRLRGLLLVFKLLKCLERVSYKNFFVLDENISRQRHTLKLVKSRARLDIRLPSFSH